MAVRWVKSWWEGGEGRGEGSVGGGWGWGWRVDIVGWLGWLVGAGLVGEGGDAAVLVLWGRRGESCGLLGFVFVLFCFV